MFGIRSSLRAWKEALERSRENRRKTVEVVELARQFDMPYPFTVEGLARSVEAVVGRRIVFEGCHMAGRGTGSVSLEEGEDGELIYVIRFEVRTPRSHQERIKLHELAHLICRHMEQAAKRGGIMKHLTGSAVPQPEFYRDPLTGLTDEDEEQAELMAGVLQSMALTNPLTGMKDADTRDMVERAARFNAQKMGNWKRK